MMLFSLGILCAGIGAQVVTSDPFYNKSVKDYPDYDERESQVKPKVMQLRLAQTASKVGSIEEAKRLFNLAGLAYCSNETLRTPNSKYNTGLGGDFKVVLVMEDLKLETKGLIAVDGAREQILLGFRGTTSTANWEANLKFNKKKFGPGLVHEGFKELTDALQLKYREYLTELLQLNPTYRLVIVGHSLGGAMAVLSAVYMAEVVPWERISVYTYGQPRVGDEQFVQWLNSQPMEMTRVVNDNDSVPHLPPNFAGFFHAHTEMFIRGNDVRVCSTQALEDRSCSRTRVALPSSVTHSNAFGMSIQESNCRLPHEATRETAATERAKRREQRKRK
ncbi:hypothetical protein DSO57_1014132 [Entomophthora muscae]|uniref:Uncharacterized protein n=1 Tax=Entomophthora muscae TaxID=34485 RepID=A0ACC2RKD6_9FUNG|nr:hypothetical protein DSO57_1014132 [Entomophthora muscae]